MGATAVLPGFLSKASAAGTPLDITFYEVGDPHYRAFDTTSSNHNVTLRSNLGKMAALTSTTPMPGGAGTVGTAIGVINVGDLVESGSEGGLTKTQTLEAQWEKYIADFGLLGNEEGTLVKLPVYEGYGNHDQDGFLKQVSDRIAARAAQLPNITAASGSFTYQGAYGNITVTGVHYAWKWGPFHFVQTNMRVGNDSRRYPSSGSYTFLKDYLENHVGNSGDPVFVVVHLPPTTGAEGDWPKEDRQAFYDLIIKYNTVGILNGHTHGYAFFQWRGPDNDGEIPIQVYQCDAIQRSGSTQGIFTVFRILGNPNDPTKATIYTAQRVRNNTWGNVTSREIGLSVLPPDTDPDPDPDPDALNVLQWQSVNSHNGVGYGLPIVDNAFVEPRQAGLRRIEVLFDEEIVVSNLSSAVAITGVDSSGSVTPSSFGIDVQVAIDAVGDSLVITFSSGGTPVALPDAAKWRFVLNVAVISGIGGKVLNASGGTMRVITGLVGDFDGNGRVSGLDLNQITNTTAFDPAIEDCLRADIDGDALIGGGDIAVAWANRSKRTDTLPTP